MPLAKRNYRPLLALSALSYALLAGVPVLGWALVGIVIGLAKKEERVFIAGRKEPVKLPRNSPALQLLQCVRDEAHRFARHYHHILRRKRVMGE